MSDYWQPGVRLGEAIGVLGQKTCSRFLKKMSSLLSVFLSKIWTVGYFLQGSREELRCPGDKKKMMLAVKKILNKCEMLEQIHQ